MINVLTISTTCNHWTSNTNCYIQLPNTAVSLKSTDGQQQSINFRLICLHLSKRRCSNSYQQRWTWRGGAKQLMIFVHTVSTLKRKIRPGELRISSSSQTLHIPPWCSAGYCGGVVEINLGELHTARGYSILRLQSSIRFVPIIKAGYCYIILGSNQLSWINSLSRNECHQFTHIQAKQIHDPAR